MIHIPVNLATDPFRRDRPILVASVAAAAVLAVTLLLQIGVILSSRNQAADTHVAIDRLNSQLSRIGAQQTKLDITLSRPENAEVLERSLFLNDLIGHKAISWTRIFADLEKVLPYNVRLMQVRAPQIDSQNHVLLEMVVAAESPQPVIEFMRRLEKASEYGPATLVNTIPPSQTDKLLKCRLSVNYAQKL